MKSTAEISLLASATVFKKLNDNQKDIYDIISSFVYSTIVSEKKRSFSIPEIKTLVCEKFDFDIPEGVFKTAIRNRLTHIYTEVINGEYIVKPEILNSHNGLGEDEQKAILKITESICEYAITTSEFKKLQASSKDVFVALQEYLLGKVSVKKELILLINAYIVSKEDDQATIKTLNDIKEGLILYAGVKNSTGPISQGSWLTELTLYLDTEIIFDLAGYSGELHKRIAGDLISLINEINANSVNRNKKTLIKLRYFEETWRDIVDFFFAAEQIVRNREVVHPGRNAMSSIVKSATNPSDVIATKALLFEMLDRKGISKVDDIDFSEMSKFNLVDEATLKTIKNECEESDYKFNREKCINVLTLFSKVNYMRNGNSSGGFENVHHILLTGASLTKYLAYTNLYKDDSRDIPYATDIDFIVNKFWFKLNKGFGGKNPLPESINVLTNAKIIISSHVNEEVVKEYDLLVEKRKRGTLTEENLKSIIIELKKTVQRPDDVEKKNVSSLATFISSDSLERHERDLLDKESELKKGKVAVTELDELKSIIFDKKISKARSRSTYIYKVALMFEIMAAAIIVLLICILFIKIRTDVDTNLALIGTIATVLTGGIGILLALFNIRCVIKYPKKWALRYFKKQLRLIDYNKPIA